MDNELAIKRANEYLQEIDEKYMLDVLKILNAYREKSRKEKEQ